MLISHTPFRTYIETILSDQSDRLDMNTLLHYDFILEKYVYPYLQDIPVCDISDIEIMKVRMNCKNHNLAPPSENQVRSLIRRVFMHAVSHRLLEDNPVDKIWKPVTTTQNPFCYSYEELQLVINAIENSELRNLYYTACFTGLSPAELFGLTWDNIDFMHYEITINKIARLDRASRELIYEPERTRGFNRVLQVDPFVINEFLLNQHEYRRIPGCNIVFPDRQGHNLLVGPDYHKCNRELKNASGLSGVNIRNLRSTFVLYEINNGENLLVLKYQMGILRSSSLIPYLKASNKTIYSREAA